MFSFFYKQFRQNGIKAQLYHSIDGTVDYTTGVSSPNISVAAVNILQLEAALSFSALVKSTTFFKADNPDSLHRNMQSFLIDSCTLPNGWTVSENDWLVVNNKRFTLSNIDLIPKTNVIFAMGTFVNGPTKKINTINVVTYLSLVGAAVGV